MGLLRWYLRSETAELHKNGVRLRVIGDRSRLPNDIVGLIESAEKTMEENSGLFLVLALSYGGRQDILNAAKSLAENAAAGQLDASQIDEQLFQSRLETNGLPDPDLLIRTSGEQRISNFLIWQMAYTEFVFSDVLWPDFDHIHFEKAVEEFRRRDRRYGATIDPAESSKLGKRIASALLLFSIASASIWLNGWYTAIFFSILAAIMLWEWFRLTSVKSAILIIILSVLGGCLPLLAAQITTIILVGVLAAVFMVGLAFSCSRFGIMGLIIGVGPPLIMGTMFSVTHLRALPEVGLQTVIWVILLVCAMDIGGYVVGKTVGGPRLAPAISPNKTWSGLIGGVCFAIIVSGSFASFIDGGSLFIMSTLGGILAVIAQGGDSLSLPGNDIFNVKDSSALLPGHGGFLDRFDGYLTVVPIVTLMTFLAGSPITWH